MAADLAEPLHPQELTRLQDPAKTLSVLIGSFQRAADRHAFILTVDHQDCGAAADIFFVDTDDLPEVLDDLREDIQVVTAQALDPAVFRWYGEDALDARDVHDEEGPAEPLAQFEDEEEEGPPYPVLATLLRARLTALPQPRAGRCASTPRGQPCVEWAC